MRRPPTTPGGYAVSPEQEDIPTQPQGLDMDTVALARMFGDMTAVERRHLVALVKSWTKCTLDQRVIVEAVAREFTPDDS